MGRRILLAMVFLLICNSSPMLASSALAPSQQGVEAERAAPNSTVDSSIQAREQTSASPAKGRVTIDYTVNSGVATGDIVSDAQWPTTTVSITNNQEFWLSVNPPTVINGAWATIESASEQVERESLYVVLAPGESATFALQFNPEANSSVQFFVDATTSEARYFTMWEYADDMISAGIDKFTDIKGIPFLNAIVGCFQTIREDSAFNERAKMELFLLNWSQCAADILFTPAEWVKAAAFVLNLAGTLSRFASQMYALNRDAHSDGITFHSFVSKQAGPQTPTPASGTVPGSEPSAPTPTPQPVLAPLVVGPDPHYPPSSASWETPYGDWPQLSITAQYVDGPGGRCRNYGLESMGGTMTLPGTGLQEESEWSAASMPGFFYPGIHSLCYSGPDTIVRPGTEFYRDFYFSFPYHLPAGTVLEETFRVYYSPDGGLTKIYAEYEITGAVRISGRPTPAPTIVPTATATPSPTPTPTIVPVLTASPLPTTTQPPTAIPVTPTTEPTPTPTPETLPSPTATLGPTSMPISTPEPAPSPSATLEPTFELSVSNWYPQYGGGFENGAEVFSEGPLNIQDYAGRYGRFTIRAKYVEGPGGHCNDYVLTSASHPRVDIVAGCDSPSLLAQPGVYLYWDYYYELAPDLPPGTILEETFRPYYWADDVTKLWASDTITVSVTVVERPTPSSTPRATLVPPTTTPAATAIQTPAPTPSSTPAAIPVTATTESTLIPEPTSASTVSPTVTTESTATLAPTSTPQATSTQPPAPTATPPLPATPTPTPSTGPRITLFIHSEDQFGQPLAGVCFTVRGWSGAAIGMEQSACSEDRSGRQVAVLDVPAGGLGLLFASVSPENCSDPGEVSIALYPKGSTSLTFQHACYQQGSSETASFRIVGVATDRRPISSFCYRIETDDEVIERCSTLLDGLQQVVFTGLPPGYVEVSSVSAPPGCERKLNHPSQRWLLEPARQDWPEYEIWVEYVCIQGFEPSGVIPVPTPTQASSVGPTPMGEPTFAPTPTGMSTVESAPEPTPTLEPITAPVPTDVPLVDPMPEPTPMIVPTAMPEPREQPNVEPTPEPTPTAVPVPTESPVVEPTPEPTPVTLSG